MIKVFKPVRPIRGRAKSIVSEKTMGKFTLKLTVQNSKPRYLEASRGFQE